MFCVVCGAEGETYDGLCKECFIKRGKFVDVPDNVDIVLCAHCRAMLVGNHWEHVDDPVTKGGWGTRVRSRRYWRPEPSSMNGTTVKAVLPS